MKVTIVHGQMHKGSTYHIVHEFLDALPEGTEVEEFFLPRDSPDFCIGCYTCFTRGESCCPHHGDVGRIVGSLEGADVIVLDSPCYVMGVTGPMKAFLDHTGYMYAVHRPYPSMFSKVGVAVVTAAGGGTRPAGKCLTDNLFHWGVAKVHRACRYNVRAACWDHVSEKQKAAIHRDMARLASKVSREAGHVKPGLKCRAWFSLMVRMHKGIMKEPIETEHWNRYGWLDGKRPWR